jgi:Flp pilus assembly protein TadG
MGHKRLPGRRSRGERGAAAVEFALVSLVFFTLMFGILQFGMWFWAWQQSGHAAREASRFAAVYPSCTSGITDKGEEALEGAPVTSSSVTPSGAAPTQVGDPITVTVTAQTIDIGFFDFFTPGITKAATSRVENIPSGGPCP